MTSKTRKVIEYVQAPPCISITRLTELCGWPVAWRENTSEGYTLTGHGDVLGILGPRLTHLIDFPAETELPQGGLHAIMDHHGNIIGRNT